MTTAFVKINNASAYACGRNGKQQCTGVELWSSKFLEQEWVYLDTINSKGNPLSGSGFRIPAVNMDQLAINWLLARGLFPNGEDL